MFWIPVCVIVIFIYYILFCRNSILEGKAEYQSTKNEEMYNNFLHAAKDYVLEEQVKKKYANNFNASQKAVCNFVGEQLDNTKQYELILQLDEWAVAAEMSKQGKLPSMMLFENKNIKSTDVDARCFGEKYLLKLESELQKAGTKTFLVLLREDKTSDSYTIKHEKLESYIKKNGYGKTLYSDKIQWVQNTVYALEYQEML